MRIVLAILALSLIVRAEEKPNYIGAAKCGKMCHNSEKKGAQYTKWQQGPHAKAFKTLETDKAKEVAKKAGIEGDPQKTASCVKCHVTAHGVADERLESTFKKDKGVQCESCHGPGSEYKSFSVMKNKEKALAKGMIEPTKEVCTKCHNEESPTYKPFKYEERVKEIAHPNPQKDD